MSISSPSSTLTQTRQPVTRQPASALAASVIIPTYNRFDYLKATLASLREQSLADPFEIIVVDNACSTELADYISELNDAKIRYISQPSVGLHNARHSGARAAGGEILIYLDDDVLLPDGWLAAMLAPYQDPCVSCVGGKTVLKFEQPPPSWLRKQLRAYLSEWDLGSQQRALDNGESPVGCNFSVRKDVLFELGGFNPDAFGDSRLIYQRGDGECGLVAKIKAAGYKTIYQPQAWLYHRVLDNRMTPEYFARRLFIEGITSNYRCFRERPIGSFRLLFSAAFQGLCWIYHRMRLLLRSNTLPVRLAAAFRWGRFGHSFRLLFSPKLRAHVLRPSYLAQSQSIIVIFPPPYLDSSPGMRSLVERLADEGCEVYVLTAGSAEYAQPSFESQRIHYLTVAPRSERSLPFRYLPLAALLAGRALRLARRIRPAWIIGALPTGLLGATLAAFFSPARSIYFSLELYPSAETKGLGAKLLKFMEKFANRFAAYTIIQDMYRGQQLIDDHSLKPERVLHLPNSRSGWATHSRSDYLQKRFSIPSVDRVILYAGGIADWAESADLAEKAMHWPSDWQLVFHSPQIRSNDPYIDALRAKANEGRITFSPMQIIGLLSFCG